MTQRGGPHSFQGRPASIDPNEPCLICEVYRQFHAGEVVSRGYPSRDFLTAEKFVGVLVQAEAINLVGHAFKVDWYDGPIMGFAVTDEVYDLLPEAMRTPSSTPLTQASDPGSEARDCPTCASDNAARTTAPDGS